MAHQTVLVCLLGLVAIHAPAHFQRRDLLNPLHLRYLTMTTLAFDARSNMSLMGKTGEGGQGMDPSPWNGLLALPIVLHFQQLWFVGRFFMAANTGLDRRNTRSGRDPGGRVTVQTVQPVLANMELMAKGDWLARDIAPSGETQIQDAEVPPRRLAIVPHALADVAALDSSQHTDCDNNQQDDTKV